MITYWVKFEQEQGSSNKVNELALKIVYCVFRQSQDAVSWEQRRNQSDGSVHEAGWTEGMINYL